MRFFFYGKAKPSKSASKDATRPSLMAGRVVEHDGGRALVTCNAYTFARVKVPDDTPLIPIGPEALKEIEKGGEFDAQEDGSIRVIKPFGEVTYKPPHQMPETFDKVLEQFGKDHKRVQIALNPKLLLGLAQAIGATENIHLHIPVCEAGKPLLTAILATTVHGHADGLIMPIRIDS